MKDYRLTVKIQNNYLFSMMKLQGIDNAAALARAAGMTPTIVGYILNLKIPAYTKSGEVVGSVRKLCTFFSCEPEDLFPPQHLAESLPVNKAIAEANQTDLLPQTLLAGTVDPLKMLEAEDDKISLDALLLCVTTRERETLILRYGLDGGGERTLEEVGNALGVGKERVRQIEAKAFRKLSKKAKALDGYEEMRPWRAEKKQREENNKRDAAIAAWLDNYYKEKEGE